MIEGHRGIAEPWKAAVGLRNHRIDGLRFIGLTLIILAHSELPVLVRQLRNFDVPLMVLVSGMSFGLSSGAGSYLRYVWRRVERLVLPSWIFLIAYSLFNLAMLLAVDYTLMPLSARSLQAVFLMRDQGFFWIIRVFLLVALLAPFVVRLDRAVPDSRKYVGLLVATYIVYEVARVAFWPDLQGAWAGPFTEWVLYAVPYAVVFAVGLRIDSMPRRLAALLAVASLAAFAVIGFALAARAGGFVPNQELKYPPAAYYMTYGLGMAMLLALIPERFWTPLRANNLAARAILFVGRNSLWVYLWHIVFADIVRTGFVVKTLLVLILSTATAFAQHRLVTRVVIPRLESHSARAHVLRLFTG